MQVQRPEKIKDLPNPLLSEAYNYAKKKFVNIISKTICGILSRGAPISLFCR